jgi:outer membrane lipoprotein-sorting protein
MPVNVPVLKIRLALLLVLLLAGISTQAQNAESILEKSRDTYAQMASYVDTGVVLVEYGTSSEDQHTFSTAFNRAPRHLLLDFHKQGGDRLVIWADPNGFHTWWKTTSQQADYPNPNNAGALSLSAPNTMGVALKVPTLLYRKAFSAVMLKLANPVLDGTEDIGAHHCYRVTGRTGDVYAATGNEVNVRKVTVSIDAESFLIRKMVEEWKPLPGQRNRITTSFDPQSNLTIDETKFKFTPPSQ